MRAKLNDDMIFFSVQDLFGYWKAHVTMSGIQRVQAGIALYAIQEEGERVGFLLNDLTDSHVPGEFFLVDNAVFRDIILYASGEKVDHDLLRAMLAECEQGAVRIRPVKGQTIVLLGAFWGHGNTIDQYLTSRRNGVIIGAYVYDIIPLTHPEYCKADLVREHSMSVCEMGLVVDFVFTISDFTRHALAALFAQNGGREIPMYTVPLAHSMTTEVSAVDAWPMALRAIKGAPYVTYVSTVEGRKNHRYVVEAWQQLIDMGVDVPDLVFVGREGWRIGGLMDLLDGTRYLGGRVHIVHDLSDAELNSIYTNAMFTVFTSFVEGWGLPVGESLVHGTPCVASGTSSIPEVGGEFVDYVDPLNLRDGVAVLRRMIEDKDYLQTRRRAIEEHFVARTWDDVGRDFLARTRAAVQRNYPERLIYPRLAEGAQFFPGNLVTNAIRYPDYVPAPMRLALRESFYHLEEHGVWMRGNIGEISFLTGLDENTEVIAYLQLSAPPHGAGNLVTAYIADGSSVAPSDGRFHSLEFRQRALMRARGRVREGGLCTILIELRGQTDPGPADGRLFGVGLTALGYVRADNAMLREDLVERFTFHDMTDESRSSLA
ncbi:glycosyltransferase family 4 protein [Sphingomonas abietis]|uniref:Glycosyltransferase family 1 protein n=1 Tax=Sphingomonas abietis TaxID=3012344 RepID=A0ABY7NPM3_9SPHN|nr:glycosyltransferase family 1 protein [Sphingomonas abietis]WBO22740.1 glycosyltransferase family 1 protein [Sphingomonas abietis]